MSISIQINIERDMESSNPLDELCPEGFDQIIIYNKEKSQNYKSKSERQKIKIDKLNTDMNDPAKKYQRNLQRREADKKKMQKILVDMTKEEVRSFINQRKQKKLDYKEKLKIAKQSGQPVFIDLVFEEKMNGKENRSLGKQIQLIYKSSRQLNEVPNIHLCNFSGGIKNQLEKMGYQYWNMNIFSENIVEVASKINKKLIYLSPDAPEPLEKVESDTAYILGGLIDRTIIKYASLSRAKSLNIEARHLPIRKYMINRSCLNLDHVVMILCKFKETNDWKVAFDFGAPKRWKKDVNQEEKELIDSEEDKEKEQEKQEEKQQKQDQFQQGQESTVQKQQAEFHLD